MKKDDKVHACYSFHAKYVSECSHVLHGIVLKGIFGPYIFFRGSQQTKIHTMSSLTNPYYSRTNTEKLNITNTEWKKILPPEVYHIAREKGTEWAFSGKYWNFEGLGTYYCAACGNALFTSDSKFASSCGWPSFFEAIRPDSVIYERDLSYGMVRVEVRCGRCDAHLGHIFDDGPKPTGKRFCINSLVIDFEPHV
ncbi:MAG TPA: peptide-methionine (R)-S-oxide reductase MsrB [Cytophagales bacterium]|nr:peptide-methionine (R)-S-oxide reductase MsrB [Cytophagales bacterium]